MRCDIQQSAHYTGAPKFAEQLNGAVSTYVRKL
jgi:hypothetical protein